MPNPKSNQPLPTFLEPPKRSTLREIRAIRKLITQIRAKMRAGTLDHTRGGALLTQSCNSIARLLLAEHRIAPPADRNPFSALRAEFDRMLRELGYGENT